MSFFRVISHLLPRAQAWRVTVEKTLRGFFEGLAEWPEDVREFIDDVYEDLFPTSTRELAEWEKQYGLSPAPDATEEARRTALAAEWQATGGQSPSYLQGVLQTAGFDLYVHDFWESGPPYIPWDPRDYTERPLVGTNRCSTFASQKTCSGYPSRPRCNRILTNDVGYLVNQNLTRTAPPAVPDDPTKWPSFLYVGAEAFPDTVPIPITRRLELERLLLKLCPTEKWIVTRIHYGEPYTNNDEDELYTDNGGEAVYVANS